MVLLVQWSFFLYHSTCAGDGTCLFSDQYFSTTRKEVRDCTTCGPTSHLSIVQFTLGAVTILRAFSRHHRMSDPVCCSFQHHLHLTKSFAASVGSQNYCYAYNSHKYRTNGCVHLIFCRSQPPVAYHFRLQFSAAGCVHFFSLEMLLCVTFWIQRSIPISFWTKILYIIPELLENQWRKFCHDGDSSNCTPGTYDLHSCPKPWGVEN